MGKVNFRSGFATCLSTVQEKTQQGYEATMEFVVGKHESLTATSTTAEVEDAMRKAEVEGQHAAASASTEISKGIEGAKSTMQEGPEKIPELVAKKEQAIIVLRQEVAEEKENTLRAKADAEEDRQNLLTRIQQLADELTNAINTSKHMKETAVKAMRQPGSCISPEKFAQLIMELEELKDQMRSIGSDRDNEKEAINSLRQQLRRNRRGRRRSAVPRV
eukprot:s63_g25.t1